MIGIARPLPPLDLTVIDAEIGFVPSPELAHWAHATFIAERGPLFNPRHAHLDDIDIGWLWTNAEAANRDRAIAGECRIVQPAQRKWASAQQHHQLRQWFGETPDIVITIYAPFAAETDDWSFCALVEHELCHAAQDVDTFGEPRFSQDGKPLLRLISHDVEQFVDVVERYGALASGVSDMVRVANKGAQIGEASVTAACGTCARRAA